MAKAAERLADFILEAVQEYYEPQQVFPEGKLVSWAEENGFVKENSVDIEMIGEKYLHEWALSHGYEQK